MSKKSLSVLVCGFDYGTSPKAIQNHMAKAGPIKSVEVVSQGAMSVTYSSVVGAKKAVAQLQQTNVAGNSRYIDVLPLDPMEFLAGHTIEEDKAQQFFEMTPEQQQAVIAKGSLSSARDPTAVLTRRMTEIRGDGVVKSAVKLGGLRATSVLVRGFDFGTTDDLIRDHMSNVGTVQKVQIADQGAAVVTYGSKEEAMAAVANLQQTIIPPNSRYIDVLPLDPKEFLAGHPIEEDKASRFCSMTPEQQMAVIAKGTLSTARDPTGVLVSRMNQVGGGATNLAGGLSGKGGPVGGKSSVLVCGFDFGTTTEDITHHMSDVGVIQSVQAVDQGTACVTYSSPDEAKLACSMLSQSIIGGNNRYIDVLPCDPEEFVAGHNIDMAKAVQFFAMTPLQRQAVIAKGSLASARNPEAVLVQRMSQVKAATNKGPARGGAAGMGNSSYGPARGGGGVMGKGPYGGGGGIGQKGGFMGKGDGEQERKLAVAMQLVELLGL